MADNQEPKMGEKLTEEFRRDEDPYRFEQRVEQNGDVRLTVFARHTIRRIGRQALDQNGGEHV